MHPGDIVNSVKSPGDSGLVRHYRDWDACPIELRDRFCCPVDEFDAVDGAYVPVVYDDSAVTIEKDPGARMRARRYQRLTDGTIGCYSFSHLSSPRLVARSRDMHKSTRRAAVIRRLPRRPAIGLPHQSWNSDQAFADGLPNTSIASAGGAPNSLTTVSSSKLLSSATLMKSRMAVPVQCTSARGAPRPAIRSLTSTVRKSTLNLARPDVFGIDACSWAPENNRTSPGAGRMISSWSGRWSSAPGRVWRSLVTCAAVVSRLALFS